MENLIMAKAIKKIVLSAAENIPYDKLVLSQKKVRRIKDGVSIEQLAEDIGRRTLLQSLNVRPVLDEGGEKTDTFEVPAGGRRYLALGILVKQKRLAKNEPIPCIDKGLETTTAESIVVTDRRTVYTHPVSGAQSHVLTVARKDRIRPLGLAGAFDIVRAEPQSVLLVNARSSRAAVQLPTASLMLDDGTVERRVRLVRPTDELRFGLDALAETHWQPADNKLFGDLWEAEVAAVPDFATSIFHIVTGLLLPIWRRLPDDDCREPDPDRRWRAHHRPSHRDGACSGAVAQSRSR